jgi:hypothetical protein
MTDPKLTLKFLKELFTKDDENLVDQIELEFIGDDTQAKITYSALTTFNKKLNFIYQYYNQYQGLRLSNFQKLVNRVIPENYEREDEIKEMFANKLKEKKPITLKFIKDLFPEKKELIKELSSKKVVRDYKKVVPKKNKKRSKKPITIKDMEEENYDALVHELLEEPEQERD